MRESEQHKRWGQAQADLDIDNDYNGRRPPLDYPEHHQFGRLPVRPGPEPWFWRGIIIGFTIGFVIIGPVVVAIWVATH